MLSTLLVVLPIFALIFAIVRRSGQFILCSQSFCQELHIQKIHR